MKVVLRFEVDVDEEKWRAFLTRWPYFADDTPADTLIREAVAAWDSESLLGFREPVATVEAVPS